MSNKTADPDLLDEYYESGACHVMSFPMFVKMSEGESRQKIRKPIERSRKEVDDD